MKYVIYDLDTHNLYSSVRYDSQEEALKAIRRLSGFRRNLAVLLVGSSTHEEVNGL